MTTQSSDVVASGDLSGSYRYEIVKNQRGYCVGVGIDTLDGWHAHPTLAEALLSLGIAEISPKARQRLIASAPALYEALKAIAGAQLPLMTRDEQNAFEHHQSDCDAYRIRAAKVFLDLQDAARAALSQAEGK